MRLLNYEIMSRFDKIFAVLICYWWIFILCRYEVYAYEYLNDVLNPVKVGSELWHQRDTRVAIRTDEELACERPNVYICEEPPNIVSSESTKTCNYRNVEYHEQLFRWVAGRGCLLYTPDFLYTAGFNNISLNAGCFYGDIFSPCLEIPKEDGSCGCYPFDPGLEEVAAVVAQSIVPSAHGRWERCFYAASECCSHYMIDNVNTTQLEECKTTFDGWTCWHAAEADTTAFEVCSEFAYSNEGPSCHHFSSKHCYEDGTWELQTDYSTCSITPRLLRRYRFHIAMLAFSIASCFPAVIIFFVYKRLRITRVALHRNLLIAIIVRNILVIISRTEIYIDEITNTSDTVLSGNGIACRLLSIAERVAVNAIFVCMLVEGVYLHRLIVAVFRRQLKIKILYGIGAAIAIVPVAAWAAMMGVYDNHSCWLIYTKDHVQWILDAPRLLILLINTGLFIDVVRVLLTKIRNSENAHQLSTAKATLFLMPIFGVQFLLTAFRPSTNNCSGEQIYYYVAYTVEGLQGFTVAMLYCYVNKEVRMLLKTTYLKTESAVVSRVRRDSTYPRMSVDPKSDRRFTYSTGIPSQMDEPKDHYATIAPKLHVAEIISIQASERLAEILEPVYETIENGAINEGYDSLERSSVDNDSGFNANRESKGDHCYVYPIVPKPSIDCQDWVNCVSSPSSVYNNSLNDCETKCLERNPLNYAEITEPIEVNKRLSPPDIPKESDKPTERDVASDKAGIIINGITNDHNEPEPEDCDDMLEEIMQYIETTDPNNVPLNADLLSPNRKDDEKIIFIDE